MFQVHAMVILALSCSLLLFAAGALAEPIQKPEYVKLSYWRYAISGDTTVPLEGFGSTVLHFTGNRRMSVTQVTTLGRVAVEDVTNMTMTGSFTIPTPNGPVHVSVTLRLAVNITRNLTATEAGDSDFQGYEYMNITMGLGGATLAIGTRGIVTSTLRSNTWSFPLDANRRGVAVSSTRVSTEYTQWPSLLGPKPSALNSVGTTTTEYTSRSEQNVTVASGRFNALVVDMWSNSTVGGAGLLPGLGGSNFTRAYYSGQVRNYVEIDFYDTPSHVSITATLQDYHLASPAPWWASPPFSEPPQLAALIIVPAAGLVAALVFVRRRRRAPLPPPPPEMVPPITPEAVPASPPAEPVPLEQMSQEEDRRPSP